MTLRPAMASWFELLTARKDLARAMECLSRTGMVELEARSRRTRALPLSNLDAQLAAYRELARHYQSYWPAPAPARTPHPEYPDQMLATACGHIVAWAKQADPLIAASERASGEMAALKELHGALTLAGGDVPDLQKLARAGPILQARLIRFDEGANLQELPSLVLFKKWVAPGATYMLIVGRRTDIDEIERDLVALKAHSVELPTWLPASRTAATAAIAERVASLSQTIETAKRQLVALSEAHGLAAALGDIALMEWIRQHADKLRGSEKLAWITGWSSDADGKVLRRALDSAHVRYILRFADPPVGLNAPMILNNPKWVRAFEIFARMLGAPARNESDPSVVLAVIVPLIFGFMFGDVGQGLVILAAGLSYGRRFPLLRMLVPSGIVAIAFGFLFGSVFCRDDLVPALWFNPLEQPVKILIAALAVGAAILTAGLVLDAMQMHWRGAASRWWGCRAGLALAYIGLLMAPFRLEGLGVAAIGSMWFILGSALLADKRGFGALARGTAEFAEEALRLFVNTVSFARIGAFALAHAGLSAAVVDVAAATGPVGYWVVLALGNVLVIVLEGLVVSIQTTRLMLFEFFIRFLTGSGREFKPLPPPDIRYFPGPSLRGQS